MTTKYLLALNGEKLFPDRLSGEHDHYDLALRLLRNEGVSLQGTQGSFDYYENVYAEIFKLGYARALETDDNRLYLENPWRALTLEQKAFADRERLEKGKKVFFNEKLFEQTRRGKPDAELISSKLIDG